MNTSAIKSFAPTVRRQLIEAVTRKLDYVLTADTPDLRAAAEQVKLLREEASRDRAGLIERVAYTWFNRLAAIRFLDARGWHPFHARVLTSATGEETQPELLKLVRAGSLPEELRPHADPDRINALLDGSLPTSIAGADPQGEVYRHLVLAVCRFYHAALPFLFEKIDDETELLLPDDLLTAASVAEGFRTEITDADCDDVEIIGWLYQFYISEKKDAVMARNSAVPKEDIPAVTQLFTPHWIVRYLVENSLGRLWLLNRPNSKLREQMPYYIEGESETDLLKIARPEDIKLLDPASGSGHMLTYAFDLLVKIYEEEGYAPSQIAELILTRNLYGLEICPRAAQLAQFALLCKARAISRSAFRNPIEPQVLCLEDVRFEENELRDYIRALGLGDLFDQPVLKLLHQFEEATNFGSLIQPCLDASSIAELRTAIAAKDLGGQLFLRETHRKVLRVLAQAEALTQRYHVVVANPPYMGGKGMNGSLKSFLQGNFSKYKSDLFSAFIARSLSLSISNGQLGFMSPFVWMFISSYQELRNRLISQATLTTLVQLEYSGFDGATVPICAFALQNKHLKDYRGGYIRLSEFRGSENQGPKTLEAIDNPSCGWFFRESANEFKKIPTSPIAYWVNNRIRDLFLKPSISSQYQCKEGVGTRDDALFLKLFWEVDQSKIGKGLRWSLSDKAGDFRRWFLGMSYVLDWEDDGKRIRNYKNEDGSLRSRPQNTQFLFRSGVSWGKIGSGLPSFRFRPEGYCFNDAAPTAFGSRLLELTAMLNSNLIQYLLTIRGGTLNITTGVVDDLPILFDEFGSRETQVLVQTSELAIKSSMADWDNFETSWDFRGQPLLRPGLKGATLEASWRNWEAQSTAAIHRMQELETENNRLFIAAYGLDGELQPEVPEEQITLARADQTKDAAALLSYAVGCMMGRYSLDQPGLILADAGATVQDYLAKVPKPTFAPDQDGIIPVLDGEWFPDDVVARTREFLKVVWGAAHLDENVAWLEQALGKDLRKYFVRDLYKNHLSNERAYGYKKRPIYWLVSSPNGSFQALIYLHRYTKDTINTLLNNYLREFLHKLEARINQLTHTETTTTSAREKTAARKEAEKLRKSLKECQDWEREVVLPLAQQRIELDLDDGVKANYLKFPGLLAKIPGFEKKED